MQSSASSSSASGQSRAASARRRSCPSRSRITRRSSAPASLASELTRSAYYIENKAAKVSLQGHCAQKTSFSGKSINVKQVGHAIMRITLPDGKVESYLCTLPKLRIEGLLFGSPSVECAAATRSPR